MINQYDISHEDIRGIIRPSGPSIDPVVNLMARLVAEPKTDELPEKEIIPPKPISEEEVGFWITPVKSDEEQTAEQVVETLVGEEKIYAFGERTPGRKHLKSGDWICFYATGNGVIAHGKVASVPKKKRHKVVRNPDRYPWVFRLENVSLYTNKPIVIDATLRTRLNSFQGRDPNKSWAWFVQATRKITEHDFHILARGKVKT